MRSVSADPTRLSHTVGALAVVKDYAANIISSGSIAVLARILNALAQQPSSPELEESMAACTYALTELAKACSVVGWPPEQVGKDLGRLDILHRRRREGQISTEFLWPELQLAVLVVKVGRSALGVVRLVPV